MPDRFSSLFEYFRRMIRLYFNLAALLQVIIIAVLYFGYGALDEYVLHWTNHTNGTKDTVVSLQLAALVCVFTELKGLKGRLMFMPVWLVCFIVSWFLFHTANFENSYALMLWWLSTIMITAYFFWEIPVRIRKDWQQKKAIAEEMKSKAAAGTLTDELYWVFANAMFYNPSLLFIYAYPVWKLIYRDAIDGNEFIDHYRTMMNHMPIERLPRKIYKRWMTEMKDAVNKAEGMRKFDDPFFGFLRLQNTISEVG